MVVSPRQCGFELTLSTQSFVVSPRAHQPVASSTLQPARTCDSAAASDGPRASSARSRGGDRRHGVVVSRLQHGGAGFRHPPQAAGARGGTGWRAHGLIRTGRGCRGRGRCSTSRGRSGPGTGGPPARACVGLAWALRDVHAPLAPHPVRRQRPPPGTNTCCCCVTGRRGDRRPG